MNKSLGFFGLSVLLVLTLLSFANATMSVSSSSIILDQFGNTQTFTIINHDALNSVTISLPQATITDSKGSVATITFNSATNIIPAGGSLVVTASASVPSNFVLGTSSTVYNITGTETTNSTNSVSASLTINLRSTLCTVKDNKDLSVNIDSTKVINGFGSDQSWYPLDTVEAKINVANNGNDTIRNIIVKWELYDLTKQKKVITGDESSFSLNDGSDKTLVVDFKLSSDIMSNIKNGDNYVLYAWATGKDEAITGTPSTCGSTNNIESALGSIDVVIDSSFVVLDNLQAVNSVSCGSNVQISGTVWNIGDNDEDGIYIKVFNTDLGISQKVNVGTVDSLDSKDVTFSVPIPNNAVSGQSYDLTFQVFSTDNSIFEDSNNDKSQVVFPLTISGACSNLPPVTVAASLQSSAVSGKELDISVVITNTDSKANSFNLDLSGYSTWASLISIDKTSLNLNAGQSLPVSVKLQINNGVSGDQTFDVVVKQGTQTLTQPVSVAVQQSAAPITGFFSGLGSNTYLWGIAALNILLVLIIIIVAIRVVRKK